MAFNTSTALDQTERAVHLHEDGVGAYRAGRTSEAEPLFRAALELFEAHAVVDSPDVAAMLCDLGTLTEDRCDYRTAEPHCLLCSQQALKHIFAGFKLIGTRDGSRAFFVDYDSPVAAFNISVLALALRDNRRGEVISEVEQRFEPSFVVVNHRFH